MKLLNTILIVLMIIANLWIFVEACSDYGIVTDECESCRKGKGFYFSEKGPNRFYFTTDVKPCLVHKIIDFSVSSHLPRAWRLRRDLKMRISVQLSLWMLNEYRTTVYSPLFKIIKST